MKKPSQRLKKKRGSKKKGPVSKKGPVVNPSVEAQQEEPVKQQPFRAVTRKAVEKKGGDKGSIPTYVSKAGQFLREARMELTKVKWPTRKELFASTAVVIVLTLVVAFFLGLIDFGLIKIIKNIVG
jgi:preprotein translocase subunit SecE